MQKTNKRGKQRKELPMVVLLILVLLFAAVSVLFGICIGFLINSFINYSSLERIAIVCITLLVGIVYMVLLLILLRNSDSENVKPTKWYINCILMSLVVNLVITAVVVFSLGIDEGNDLNYIIGFIMFPLIGIVTTPNIVNYVKKDTTKWKSILYKNGNLHKIKNDKDYYEVDTPVPYEKEILKSIRKEQIKNILFVVGFMIFVIVIGIHYMITDHSYTGNIIKDLMILRAKRSFGFVFFLMIFFIAFAIPIVSFYITNALKKISVVKNHQYMAYHAIVPAVRNGSIAIYHKNKYYKYKYCTCVGIKEKNINFTPATLIFIPDDILIFPDK